MTSTREKVCPDLLLWACVEAFCGATWTFESGNGVPARAGDGRHGRAEESHESEARVVENDEADDGRRQRRPIGDHDPDVAGCGARGEGPGTRGHAAREGHEGPCTRGLLRRRRRKGRRLPPAARGTAGVLRGSGCRGDLRDHRLAGGRRRRPRHHSGTPCLRWPTRSGPAQPSRAGTGRRRDGGRAGRHEADGGEQEPDHDQGPDDRRQVDHEQDRREQVDHRQDDRRPVDDRPDGREQDRDGEPGYDGESGPVRRVVQRDRPVEGDPGRMTAGPLTDAAATPPPDRDRSAPGDDDSARYRRSGVERNDRGPRTAGARVG